MRATLTYTIARVVLFVVALLVCYLFGARNLLLIGLALVISGLASFVILSRQRDAMSTSIVSGVRNFRQRIDEGARAEDED